MTMRSLVVVVATVACGPSHDVVPSAPHNAPPRQSVADLVARAERAHAAHYPLDYKRPMERPPVGHSPATALFLDACRAGDKPSCWVAMQIAHQDTRVRLPEEMAEAVLSPLWQEAATLVEANCLQGHHLSCLALPARHEAHGRLFSTASGAAGRTAGCWEMEPALCSEAAVRKECDAGFPRSCTALADLLNRAHLETYKPGLREESEAMRKRAAEVAVAGCREGILESCAYVSYDAPLELKFVRGKHGCGLGDRCVQLSRAYVAQGDLIRARDAAERGCQYFTDACVTLGEDYLDGKLPEPVEGRGQVLVNFVCDSVRRGDGEEAMERYRPCARAKLPPLDSAD